MFKRRDNMRTFECILFKKVIAKLDIVGTGPQLAIKKYENSFLMNSLSKPSLILVY